MCEKQIFRFDGKATETAIPEINRKWLSSMMWHCLNKQQICPYRFTCQGIPWDPASGSSYLIFFLKVSLLIYICKPLCAEQVTPAPFLFPKKNYHPRRIRPDVAEAVTGAFPDTRWVCCRHRL